VKILFELLLLTFYYRYVTVYHQPNSEKVSDCGLLNVQENRIHLQVLSLLLYNDRVSFAQNRVVFSEKYQLPNFQNQFVRLVQHHDGWDSDLHLYSGLGKLQSG
jgi:hypothetical protein